MGIEPTCAAWKAAVLPLNYTRLRTGARLQLDLQRVRIIASVHALSIQDASPEAAR